MTDFSLAWSLLAVMLVLIGLAGTIVPALPTMSTCFIFRRFI